MWVNPKYRDQVEQPAAPQDNGQRLATFPRGKNEEFRVTLAEFNGNPFVSLRVWEQNQDGAWWPVKGKGCSVRVGEVAELADALSRVEDLLAEPGRREGPPPRREPVRQPTARGARPAPPFEPTQTEAPFDEF